LNALGRIITAMGKGVKVLVGCVLVVAVFWAIAYRFILPFTPPWLDYLTIAITGVALVGGWAIGRNNKFDYSRRVGDPLKTLPVAPRKSER
jgi:TRAP-type C4-dicarboxylate transport system permease small subunit